MSKRATILGLLDDISLIEEVGTYVTDEMGKIAARLFHGQFRPE